MGKVKNVLVVPRYLVTLRFIELPSIDASEISQMAGFQALKEFPYPKEEIITSFKNLGSRRNSFSYIMLIIAKRQIMEQLISEAENKPESIRLETELFYLHLLKPGILKHGKVALAIGIHKDYSEVMAMDNKIPVFSRGFKNEDCFQEIKRSLTAYKRDKGAKDIDEIVVIYHSGMNMEKIKSNIKKYFEIPVGYYECKEDLNDLRLSLEIDLLPRDLIDRELFKENIKEVLLTYALLAVIVVMAASLAVFKFYEKNKLIAVLSEKTGRIQPGVEALKDIIKKTGAVKSQKDSGEFIINILKGSYGLVPGDIALSYLDYDGKDTMHYKGMAQEMTNVFNFVKVLEKSGYFEKVDVKYATKKRSGNLELADFSISCKVR